VNVRRKDAERRGKASAGKAKCDDEEETMHHGQWLKRNSAEKRKDAWHYARVVKVTFFMRMRRESEDVALTVC